MCACECQLLRDSWPFSVLGAGLLTCMRFFNLSSSSGVQAPFLLSSTSDIQRRRDCPQRTTASRSAGPGCVLSRQLTGPDTPQPVTGLRVQQERRPVFSATIWQENLLGPAPSDLRPSRSKAGLRERVRAHTVRLATASIRACCLRHTTRELQSGRDHSRPC